MCDIQVIKFFKKMEPMDTDELKIANIPYDCLEFIFNNLNMADLFCVTLTNKNFIESAVSAFERNFGHKTFYIDPYKVCLYKNNIVISQNAELQFTQSCNQFAFLRNFGKSISKLKVVGEIRNENPIKQYFLEYCPNAIIDIELYIYFSWHSNLTFVHETLCEIDNDTKELAIACERLNDDLFEKLPTQLEYLALRCKRGYIDDNCTSVIFDKVKKFKLIAYNAEVFEENPPSIDFGCLYSLEFVGFENLSDKWLDFIMKNKHLTKLTLCPSSNVICKRNTFPKKLLRKLCRHLEILEVDIELINLDYVLTLLHQSKTLMEIRMYWETHNNADISMKLRNIPKEWTYYCNLNYGALINKQFQNKY